MPIFVRNNSACLFIHIPKAGGSTFEKLAKENKWRELLSVRGVHQNQLKFFKSSPQHFHADLLDRIITASEFDKIILICRNPFTRMKSEYYWQRKQKVTDDSPGNWINQVMSECRNNPYVYDNHLRHQIDFLLNDDRLRIFKLEENGISNAIDYLEESGPKLNKIVNGLFAKKAIKEKKSTYINSVEDEFSKHYDDIFNFYRQDFEYFGYDNKNA
jgi:hypothetical protein